MTRPKGRSAGQQNPGAERRLAVLPIHSGQAEHRLGNWGD